MGGSRERCFRKQDEKMESNRKWRPKRQRFEKTTTACYREKLKPNEKEKVKENPHKIDYKKTGWKKKLPKKEGGQTRRRSGVRR